MFLQQLTGTLRDSRMQDVQNINTLSRQFSYGLRPNDHSQEVELVQRPAPITDLKAKCTSWYLALRSADYDHVVGADHLVVDFVDSFSDRSRMQCTRCPSRARMFQCVHVLS